MRNYAAYLPSEGPVDAWGVRLTAIGHTTIAPSVPYPPGRHPADHALDWSRGRVLSAYQLVYITAGRGRFESKESGSHRIVPGSLFLLFPGVWHRYRPQFHVGWTEDWIELQGPALDRLRRARKIRPATPIFRPGLDPAFTSDFAECHALASAASKGYQSILGLFGLQFLARAVNSPRRPSPITEGGRSVTAAQARIAEADAPASVQDLVTDMTVSYSYLRRAFKARTGVTLKRYQMQVRLRRAQEALVRTDLSLKEIAEMLGYNSPFHFSTDFKRHTGLSPKPWRQRYRGHEHD